MDHEHGVLELVRDCHCQLGLSLSRGTHRAPQDTLHLAVQRIGAVHLGALVDTHEPVGLLLHNGHQPVHLALVYATMDDVLRCMQFAHRGANPHQPPIGRLGGFAVVLTVQLGDGHLGEHPHQPVVHLEPTEAPHELAQAFLGQQCPPAAGVGAA